jgi:hypothetical protein
MFYNLWLSMHVMFPIFAPNSNHSPPFPQSTVLSVKTLELGETIEKKLQKCFEIIVMLVFFFKN